MKQEIQDLTVGEQLEHTLSGGNVIVLNYADEGCIEVFCCEDSSDTSEVRWSKTFKTMEEAEKEYYRFD